MRDRACSKRALDYDRKYHFDAIGAELCADIPSAEYLDSSSACSRYVHAFFQSRDGYGARCFNNDHHDYHSDHDDGAHEDRSR